MTFSIAARCEHTGMLGVAISSSSPAVAARCAFTRAGTGAVLSQNVTDPRLGVALLDALETGLGASSALRKVVDEAKYVEYRQLIVVDHHGDFAIHSGDKALGIWSEAGGQNAAAGGNLLANPDIPQAILTGFHEANGHLGDRLIAAMRAGLEAGGEAGPVHSAGMQIADKQSWPVVDLRCDWSDDCPIEALAQIWDIYKPQLEAYVTRALDPREAPSYRVPGDL